MSWRDTRCWACLLHMHELYGSSGWCEDILEDNITWCSWHFVYMRYTFLFKHCMLISFILFASSLLVKLLFDLCKLWKKNINIVTWVFSSLRLTSCRLGGVSVTGCSSPRQYLDYDHSYKQTGQWNIDSRVKSPLPCVLPVCGPLGRGCVRVCVCVHHHRACWTREAVPGTRSQWAIIRLLRACRSGSDRDTSVHSKGVWHKSWIWLAKNLLPSYQVSLIWG